MDSELDRKTHQRVMEFLSLGSGSSAATLEAPYESDLAAPEIPASIADQTAADLVKFLRGDCSN